MHSEISDTTKGKRLAYRQVTGLLGSGKWVGVSCRHFPKVSNATKIVQNGDLQNELELGDNPKLEIAPISLHPQTPSVTEIRG